MNIKHSFFAPLRNVPKLLLMPSIILLFIWMVVPFVMTVYFSFFHYSLLNPEGKYFDGLKNYIYFFTDQTFIIALKNTFILIGAVLTMSVGAGIGIAVLIDDQFWGRKIVRLMLIAPFFIMPTVSALIWKNLILHPVAGILAALWRYWGLTPIDWFSQCPLFSIIMIISWQWIPFAVLIFMTALQSLDQEQKEAAKLDGAGAWALFQYIILPHLARPVVVVVMIETIFLLSVFAEIFTTTGGGPGYETTNLAYLIFNQALLQYDVGAASAGGVAAVVFANLAAFILIKILGKNLT